MENFNNYSLKALSALSLTVALSACGGGGSSDTPPNASNGTKSSIPAVASSKAPTTVVSSVIASSVIVGPGGNETQSSSSSVTSSSFEVIDDSGLYRSSSSVVVSSSSVAPSSVPEVPSSSSEAPSSSSVAPSSESSSSVESSSVVSSSVVSSTGPTTSSSSPAASIYHVRGTNNNWDEGLLMTRVGTSDSYQSCVNFTAATANAFKIDPNGAWGADAVPAQDYLVTKGWVKISFNSVSKTVTAEQNLGANCQSVIYLRGTQTTVAWAETDLFTPVAGSATNYEICRNFTKGDTAGGPRFKVDPNGAWGDDAFPAADVLAEGWTKVVINASTKAIVSTNTKLAENCGAVSSSSTAITSESSVSSITSESSVNSSINSSASSVVSSSAVAVVSDDFRARTTYFMFVDRFANGDPSNDQGLNPTGTLAASATDPMHLKAPILDWKKYWGGDIQGIINKLDYLQALGITAIWVTPLVDNVNDTGTEGIYHGYQARDFYAVDEHLGDWALVDKLNEEMEKRNMKLVLDIALNHSNHTQMGEFGSLFKSGVEIVKDFAAGKASGYYHNRTEIADCNDTDPLTICNTEWQDDDQVRNKMLFNLADFNHGQTANSKADEYLIGAAVKWMQHGVDAFRIDAIKHIEPSFINRFTAAINAEAAANGKAAPYVFGEWFDAGIKDPSSIQFIKDNRGSELLDFSLRDSIEQAIAGSSPMTALDADLEARKVALNGKENLQPIFLDNHDGERTSVYLQTTSLTSRHDDMKQGKGMTKVESDARQNLGMALVMTLPGVPVVYYGSEQNTAILDLAAENKQIGSDPFNREMMPSFDQTTPAFKIISALAALRQESIAIQRGSYKQVWMNADVLVFQRQQGTDCAVIAVNRGAEVSIPVSNLCLANAAYTNKVGTQVVNVAAGAGTFTIPSKGVIALH